MWWKLGIIYVSHGSVVLIKILCAATFALYYNYKQKDDTWKLQRNKNYCTFWKTPKSISMWYF